MRFICTRLIDLEITHLTSLY